MCLKKFLQEHCCTLSIPTGTRSKQKMSQLPRSPDRLRRFVLHRDICELQKTTTAISADVGGRWRGGIPSTASRRRRRCRCKWHDVIGSSDDGNWSYSSTSFTGSAQGSHRRTRGRVIACGRVGWQTHLNWQGRHLIHIVETMTEVRHQLRTQFDVYSRRRC